MGKSRFPKSIEAYIFERHGGKVRVGTGTYINPDSWLRAVGANITIGKHCRISYRVCLQTKYGSKLIGSACDERTKPIVICDNVWIGWWALIKGGVTIGDFAIVGMGAVVVKNVEPFHVVVGNPAKDIGLRLDADEIKSQLEKRCNVTGNSPNEVFQQAKLNYDIYDSGGAGELVVKELK